MHFHKYHGNGNDFIMVDNRSLGIVPTIDQITRWCDRRFGIGSDGLVLIQEDKDSDYEMVFYNPDGSQSFCGNGSRCSLHFCHQLGMIDTEARFRAIDGMHKGSVSGIQTRLSLKDVPAIKQYEDCFYADTGSPHAVVFVDDVDKVDVLKEGRALRMDKRFAPGGCNVNFVEFTDKGIRSRVFERGVENETFSSGSGTTAQALCAHARQNDIGQQVEVSTRGGKLEVNFEVTGGTYSNIYLSGPVTHVFSGELEL